jgi:hypothetical protein
VQQQLLLLFLLLRGLHVHHARGCWHAAPEVDVALQALLLLLLVPT